MKSIPLFYYKQGCFQNGKRYDYSTYLSLEVFMKLISAKYINITLRQILRVMQDIISYSKNNRDQFGSGIINSINIMIKCTPPFNKQFSQQQSYEIEIAGNELINTQSYDEFITINQNHLITTFDEFFKKELNKQQQASIQVIINKVRQLDFKGDLSDKIEQFTAIIQEIVFKAKVSEFTMLLDQFPKEQYTEFKEEPLNDFILIQSLRYFLQNGKLCDKEHFNQLQSIINQISEYDAQIPELQGFLKRTILQFQKDIIEDEKINVEEQITILDCQQRIKDYLLKTLMNSTNKTGIQFMFQTFSQFQKDTNIMSIIHLFELHLNKLISSYLFNQQKDQISLFQINIAKFKKALQNQPVTSVDDLKAILRQTYEQIENQEYEFQQMKFQSEPNQFEEYNSKINQLIQNFNNNNDPQWVKYFEPRKEKINKKFSQLQEIIKSDIFNIQLLNTGLDNNKSSSPRYWICQIALFENKFDETGQLKFNRIFTLYFNVNQHKYKLGVTVRSINDVIILKNLSDILDSNNYFKLDYSLARLALLIQEISQVKQCISQIETITCTIMQEYQKSYLNIYLQTASSMINNDAIEIDVMKYILKYLNKTEKTAYQFLFFNYLNDTITQIINKQQDIVQILQKFNIIRCEVILKYLFKCRPQYSCELVARYFSRIEQRLQEEKVNDDSQLSYALIIIYDEICDLSELIKQTQLNEIYFTNYRKNPQLWKDAFGLQKNFKWADYLIHENTDFLNCSNADIEIAQLNIQRIEDRYKRYYSNLEMAQQIIANYDKHMMKFFEKGIDSAKYQLIWDEEINTDQFNKLCYKELEEFKNLCSHYFQENVKKQMDADYQRSNE